MSTFCQLLKLRILTHRSMACAGTSVSSSAFPRFRELLEVRVAPRHCASFVQPGTCSSRASTSRRDLCSTRNFLVHVIHYLALPHDVLQNIDLPSWRLVLELFLREDVSHCKALLLRTFLGFDLCLVRLILVSVFRSLLVLLSMSDWWVCPNHDVCFDSPPWFSLPSAVPKSPRARRGSLDFVSAWAWLTLVTSVVIETSFISVSA